VPFIAEFSLTAALTSWVILFREISAELFSLNMKQKVMENLQSITKTRFVAGWILTVILSLVFITATATKFMAILHPESAAFQQLANYGLDGHITIITLGELVTIVTFLIPRTSQVALLFLSAQIGGTIATHMEHGEPFVPHIIVMYLAFFTQWLRNPNTFKFSNTHIK
jgi:hypothetical protein